MGQYQGLALAENQPLIEWWSTIGIGDIENAQGRLAVHGRSAVEVHGAAVLAVAHVVLKTGGVAAAIGLLLNPGLLGCTEVIAAAPAIAALLL